MHTFVCKHCFADRYVHIKCDGCHAPAIIDCKTCKKSGHGCDFEDERGCGILS